MSAANKPNVALPVSRREMLWRTGGGLGGVALASLLSRDGWLAGATTSPHTQVLHHPAKATRVVQLYMSGGASQCDMFDYKPELVRRNDQPWDPGEKVTLFQSSPFSIAFMTAGICI